MTETLFYIITPSYNRPDLLIRNIKALRNQDYSNWIQVIVDDCSTDPMDAAFAIAGQDERHIVITSESNKGCNQMRNCALDYIETLKKTGYIVFVDDDDYLLPDALSWADHYLRESNIPWLAANCCFPDSKVASKIKKYGTLSYIDDYMFGKNIKGDLNHFIKTDVAHKVRFPENFKNGQEWAYYCQIAEHCQIQIINKNVKIIEYLEGGLTQNKVNSQEKLKVFSYKVEILKRLVSPKKLSDQQVLLARELIKNHNYSDAKKLLISILKYKFLSAKYYRYIFKVIFK
ncbi:glycosyltransferase family 2 protein [Bacterioplanoides sp.]|uniref:glycosyltransferase family 2 protein n=1 Tax=Bacterioplanoides sp. TaxID=2066072 RepID=UPI003B009861